MNQLNVGTTRSRKTTHSRLPKGLLSAALLGLSSLGMASHADALSGTTYPSVSGMGHEFNLHLDSSGGLHFVIRSTYHVQVSAQSEDSFQAYRVWKPFQRSGVSFLLAPHLAGRFESLESGPTYMDSFVGHLLQEHHEVWGFDNRGTELTEVECAQPSVQALVESWGLDSLVADATLVRDMMDFTWPPLPRKVILGGQSLGAITTVMTVDAQPGRFDGVFVHDGTIYSEDPAVAGDNLDLDGNGFEDNPGLADIYADFIANTMIPVLGTCDLTTETLMKVVVPTAFSPLGLTLPRPELDLDNDPFNDDGEFLLDAIDAAFVAQRGTPMNLHEFVVFALSVPGPNPNAPGIPGYTILASNILDLGGVPMGNLADLGDLADPSKYVLSNSDVGRLVEDALVFGNLSSRGLLRELQATLGNLGVNPLTGVDHVDGLGAFTGHALFLAGARGFGGSVADTSALFTGATSNTLISYPAYGHSDIRFSQQYVAELMTPILDLAQAVK